MLQAQPLTAKQLAPEWQKVRSRLNQITPTSRPTLTLERARKLHQLTDTKRSTHPSSDGSRTRQAPLSSVVDDGVGEGAINRRNQPHGTRARACTSSHYIQPNGAKTGSNSNHLSTIQPTSKVQKISLHTRPQREDDIPGPEEVIMRD